MVPATVVPDSIDGRFILTCVGFVGSSIYFLMLDAAKFRLIFFCRPWRFSSVIIYGILCVLMMLSGIGMYGNNMVSIDRKDLNILRLLVCQSEYIW